MTSALKPETTSLLIRNLDPALRDRLKARARANHRSMSEEVLETLRGAMANETATIQPENLYQIARRIFGETRGVELDLPPRGSQPGRALFSWPDEGS
jgi:plasmid stability protein